MKLKGGIERMRNLSEGVALRDGLLSAEVAAKRTNMTKEEFEKLVAEE